MEYWSGGVLGAPNTPVLHHSITQFLRRYAFLDFDLDDAPSFHVDDGQVVAVMLDPFAAARDAFELRQHEARQGVIVRRFFERQVEVGF